MTLMEDGVGYEASNTWLNRQEDGLHQREDYFTIHTRIAAKRKSHHRTLNESFSPSLW